MGFGGISIWQLLIILAIVVLLFGTKKLRNVGGDLGAALKNFKGAMKDGEKPEDKEEQTDQEPASLPDGQDPGQRSEAADKDNAGKEKEKEKEKA